VFCYHPLKYKNRDFTKACFDGRYHRCTKDEAEYTPLAHLSQVQDHAKLCEYVDNYRSPQSMEQANKAIKYLREVHQLQHQDDIDLIAHLEECRERLKPPEPPVNPLQVLTDEVYGKAQEIDHELESHAQKFKRQEQENLTIADCHQGAVHICALAMDDEGSSSVGDTENEKVKLGWLAAETNDTVTLVDDDGKGSVFELIPRVSAHYAPYVVLKQHGGLKKYMCQDGPYLKLNGDDMDSAIGLVYEGSILDGVLLTARGGQEALVVEKALSGNTLCLMSQDRAGSYPTWFQAQAVRERDPSHAKERIQAVRERDPSHAKERIRSNSRLVHEGSPSLYALNLKEVVKRDKEKLHKLEFGERDRVRNVPEKVIMVVGATGAGKTTLINGMINHIFGVEWDDPYRFKLIHEDFGTSQGSSQTCAVTSYTIHHQECFTVPFTLTIVDTPGFGDTAGISRDREITNQMHSFFSTTGAGGGIDHIDAIGFVAPASSSRLTPTQKYVFDSILSLFGKDIADNIFILATFADGKKPPLYEGIKDAKFPYKGTFKFNNSAIFAEKGDGTDDDDDDDDDGGEFDLMFWDMGNKSFSRFLKKLNVIPGKSLCLTKGVLDERSHLETYIIGIQQGIAAGLNKLETFKTEKEILLSHQADIDANKNFTYKVIEQHCEVVNIPNGTYITNCLVCNRTCHYPCAIPDDEKKRGCAAMSGDNCTVCSGKCHWSKHKNMTYRYEVVRRTVTKTAADLKARYVEAGRKRMSAVQIMEKINEEFEEIQFEVLRLTEEVRKSLNRLQEIALRPNPMSSVDYIDLLIQSQKDDAKPGWHENVEHLQTLRKQAEYLKRVENQDFDPFDEYKKQVQAESPKQNTTGGTISRFMGWIAGI